MRSYLLLLAGAAVLAACSSDTSTTGSGGSGTGTGSGASTTGGGGSGTGTASGTASGTGSGTTGGGGVGGTGGSDGGASAGGSSAGGSSAGGSGQGGGAPMACTWQNGANPCGGGMYCDAPGCGQGVCVPVPNLDNPTKVPVCGCDGVNYWNADTAATHGMAVSAAGTCPTPAFCGGFGNLPCPSNQHFCNGEVPNATGCNISDPGGYCWGMPQTCSQIGFGGNRRLCSNPNGACLYECDAIKTEQVFYPDGTCPM